MIYLLLIFSLSGSIYGMDQLAQNLKDLHTSLSNLENSLQNLEVSIRPVREWLINLEKLPEIIDTLVNKIIDKFKTIENAPQYLSKVIHNEIESHSKEIANLLSPSTDKTQTSLKNQLEKILYEYFITIWTTPLNWCFCISAGKRITLIIELIEQVKITHPNREHPIVYTSLGSGGLLQDYLTIKELLNAGYKDINVNLIDLIYPDVPLAPKGKPLNVTQQIHQDFIKEEQERAASKLKLFKEKIDEFAQKNNSTVTITT